MCRTTVHPVARSLLAAAAIYSSSSGGMHTAALQQKHLAPFRKADGLPALINLV